MVRIRAPSKAPASSAPPNDPSPTIEQVVFNSLPPSSLATGALVCTWRPTPRCGSVSSFGLRRRETRPRSHRRISVTQQVSFSTLATGELISRDHRRPRRGVEWSRCRRHGSTRSARHLDHLRSRPAPSSYVFRGPKGVVPPPGAQLESSCGAKSPHSVGIEGLHFHDLRHTGNTLAAATGASMQGTRWLGWACLATSCAHLPTRHSRA